MTQELFVNGELTRIRRETHGKNKLTRREPVFTSRMEKREYYHNLSSFDIRNVLDVKGFLKDIRENWNTYVLQVHHWIQQQPLKKLIVSGIFTVVFGFFASTSTSAFVPEYTYAVKSGDKLEVIAQEHGVTAQQILDANGLSSFNGKKILLPKVQDKTVTASILNIRSKPTTNSSIVGKYKKEDVVKVSFIENGWAAILNQGRVYYVSANYLTGGSKSTQTTSNLSQEKRMYVTASSLRIREAASTSSPVLGTLQLHDPVFVQSSMNGWAKIFLNGKPAFVSETYLTTNEPIKDMSQNDTYKNNQTITDSSVYIVKSGDTFTKIGKAFGVSVSSIQKLNPTVDPTKLRIGQKIQVSSTVGPTPTVKTQTNTDSSTYIIKRGDTFTKIAKAFGISVSSIQELNQTIDPTKLKIGQTIKIPSSTTATTNQLKITAQITGIDRNGTFRFITNDGNTYAAKASGNLVNELFNLQGKTATLTLEGKRGQEMTLISLT
ncbi:LysM peptidoglycan-binding domain-containing protein [Mesobacillus maritimus]|uniref:LysM peptidoglycan-binding domain-containing protein n=1 Tax=Mesobacillus maritimus TaxID=1643336 RepID=UPI00384C64AB